MADPLYLGRRLDDDGPLHGKADRLTTHGVVIGMTGSGKTGLSITLLEELVLAGVPILALDPKGDLSNLALLFPEFRPEDFQPWVDAGEARRDGIALPDLAQKMASRWKKGLARHDMDGARVAKLRDRMALKVFTPGAASGRPIDVVAALRRPPADALADDETRAELAAGTVASLLGLAAIKADPMRSPEHLVTAQIIERAWLAGEDLDMETLILRIVDPPFAKVGVFPVDRFWKPDDRMDLAMGLNAVIASPAFAGWAAGEPLDPGALLEPRADGRVPVSVFHMAHLDEGERQFFASMLLGRLLAWSRRQPGTSSLRALLFLDEAFGDLPPHPRNPPTKKPLLTLMKQARAVGVGVLLATQNPVDLDYKALSNAGTWFVGRLSTQQDVKLVSEGLRQAGAGGEDIAARIGGLQPRQFVLRDVKEERPILFGSRWAMSFLRGPVTRDELMRLPGLQPPGGGPEPVPPATSSPAEGTARPTAPAAMPAPTPTPAVVADDDTSPRPPEPPADAGAWFLDARAVFATRMDGAFEGAAEPARADGALVHRPALYARVAMRFDEDRVGYVKDEEQHLVLFPLDDRMPDAPRRFAPEGDDLCPRPPEGARFAMLPEMLDESAEVRAARRKLVELVWRTETRGRWTCPPLKLHGRADETREQFEGRCSEAAEEVAHAKLEKLAVTWDRKVHRVRERIRRKHSQLEQLEDRLKGERAQELVNGAELLMSFFAKKRRRSLGSAASRRKATAGVASRVRAAEQDLEALAEDLADLELEAEAARDEVEEQALARLDAIVEKEVRLEKGDIQLRDFGLLWVPVTRRI